ncbi:MAG TPA: class I poly(R)-hydroxyalkanoic acid synthase, partial [Hyphomonas sp.]|nr:class I poly(R)-hydroxyalkanoic acid synthase [Hyphomonas sp.]
MSSAKPPATEQEPLAALMAAQDPMKWQILTTTLALANTESQALLTEVITGSGPLGTISDGDPMGAVDAFREVGLGLARNPMALMQANMELMQGWMKLWQEMVLESLSPEAPKEKDKRFSDPEWQVNPAFKFIRKAYDVNATWMNSLADRAEGIDPAVQLRAKFFTQLLTDSLSPTNFLGTNPQALRAFIESGGESVLAGLRMAREDVRKGNGKLYISQTDETPFEIGGNIATAPGEVVFRNDLIELLQFAPSQPQAYSKPLLIFPPWINKFYIL